MIKIHPTGAYIHQGVPYLDEPQALQQLEARLGKAPEREAARQGTMAFGILRDHNESSSMDKLRLRFDSLTSHDITYVGIIQTARASGLERFPVPYVLTNCHNSLCAVGGTINEDDHMFGLSAAKKYGGVYVPAHLAVIHQYAREMMSGGGRMILGSDSHTRYGALGTMGIGEGGPELVKQLLGRTYDIDRPEVVAVQLTGTPGPGVGPMDVAIALVGALFEPGTVKNKVMEFVGSGIANLSADFRIGIDVMTTETTCLSSIWQTDETIRSYYKTHGRESDYREVAPAELAYYDGLVTVDLSQIKPMIALPFHPSNAYTIAELKANAQDILAACEQRGREITGVESFSLRDKLENGVLRVQQGVIAGCAGGTYENLCHAAQILSGTSTGSDEFSLSVYPSSQPVNLALTENGAVAALMQAGAVVRTAFCGPCFGAGDTPANGGLSIRHATRNFPSREGSKPGNGQLASVALMDARSIAATARVGGALTAADELDIELTTPEYTFAGEVYRGRCYYGYGNAQPDAPLKRGPGIADWPAMQPLAEHLLLKVACHITDPVTTTDELIPSGETSSYRSNPLGLAEFTLSRKDPAYVGRAKAVQALDQARLASGHPSDDEAAAALEALRALPEGAGADWKTVQIGSVVVSVKPGDGSAREQAASCQKVLGTFANIAQEYATKRYRSNLINWGMLPFLLRDIGALAVDDWIVVPGLRAIVEGGGSKTTAYLLHDGEAQPLPLELGGLTADEREILLAGCLINYYNKG